MMYLTLLSIISNALFAAPPITHWAKSYGGDEIDIAHSVCEAFDGGFIVAGWTSSFGSGGSDIWILRTDYYGDTLWTKLYGGPGDDIARTILKTIDGEYAVVGYTSSYGAGNSDIWLLKLDKAGDTMWTRTYGGENFEYGRCCCLTTGNGFLIAGTLTDSVTKTEDIYIVKTKSDGEMEWTKVYGEPGRGEEGRFVSQTSDDGYIVVGTSSIDIWLLKLDEYGDTIWTNTFGAVDSLGNSGEDSPYCVGETSDGGYIIVGWTAPTGLSTKDVYIIKTDEMGGLVWEKTYGQTSEDRGYILLETSEGEYTVAGESLLMGQGNYQAYLLRIDSLGDTLWTGSYGENGNEGAYDMQRFSLNEYLLAGWMSPPGEGDQNVWLSMVGREWFILVNPDQRIEVVTGEDYIYVLEVANFTPFQNVIDISHGASNLNWDYAMTDLQGNPLQDSDSDGSVDVGLLQPNGGSTGILLHVSVPIDAPAGIEDTFVVYGYSSNVDSLRDSAVVVTVVMKQTRLIIEPDQFGSISPESPVIRYPLEVTNLMYSVQTGEITAQSTRGWPINIYNKKGRRELEDNDGSGIPDVGELEAFTGKDTIVVEVEVDEEFDSPCVGSLDSLGRSVLAAETTIVYVFPSSDSTLKDAALLITSVLPDLSIHNFPNPFEDETRIVWSQPGDGEITIRLADRAGRPVATIYEGDCQAGLHSHLWQAQTSSASALAPGVYVIVLDYKSPDGVQRHVMNKVLCTRRE